MLRSRIIPCLLLRGTGLVKGVQFKNHQYVGDPINAVQIFNSKEVDEILFLDISATSEKRIPDPGFVQRISDQCLVPFTVGGGIRSAEDAAKMFSAGAEKVCLNTGALADLNTVTSIAERFGQQSVVVSLDVKKNFFGKYEVYAECGSKKVKGSCIELAQAAEKAGCGELVINSIDRDGTRSGFDLPLLKAVSESVRIPVIAAGGAGSNEDFVSALQAGADAVSAGSLFVFHGKRNAVLISYLDQQEHKRISTCKLKPVS